MKLKWIYIIYSILLFSCIRVSDVSTSFKRQEVPHGISDMIGCNLSLSILFPNQLSTTTLSSFPASYRRNLPIKQRIISIPPCIALTSVNTFNATCTWTRRELLSSCPRCGSEAAVWTFESGRSEMHPRSAEPVPSRTQSPWSRPWFFSLTQRHRADDA